MLGAVARKYAHKIPFLVKFNHNELLTYPNIYKQTRFGSVRQCFEMGAVAVGATIYFGSEDSRRQIDVRLRHVRGGATRSGMVTVLWCYTRNNAFKVKGADGKSTDYHSSAGPHRPGQPPRRHDPGRHHQAEAADQQRRVRRAQHGRIELRQVGQARVHRSWPASDENGKGGHPIDLCRYQVLNCYMGRIPLINSGGESKGAERPVRKRCTPP